MGRLGSPYIGVTGFTTVDEVHRILMFLADGYQSRLEDRPLMVGVLVNNHTLAGEAATSVRFPSMEIVKSIFEQASDQGDLMTLRLAHYNTENPGNLGEELKCLAKYCGYSMEGVQLNCCWPSPQQLEDIRPPFFRRVVLQIGKRALEAYDYDHEAVAASVDEYANSGLITDILLDPSGGKGQLANFKSMMPTLHLIAERHPGLGIGVAGGLSSESVMELLPLFKEFLNLSIDAEGLIRTEDNSSLYLQRVCDYVTTTFSVLRKSRGI